MVVGFIISGFFGGDFGFGFDDFVFFFFWGGGGVLGSGFRARGSQTPSRCFAGGFILSWSA